MRSSSTRTASRWRHSSTRASSSGLVACQQDLIDTLCLLAELVSSDEASDSTAAAVGLRDAGDAPVLATLIATRADYLITGDQGLYAVADRYPVVAPAEFGIRHAP